MGLEVRTKLRSLVGEFKYLDVRITKALSV
jgi:hypothetical protein